MLDDRPIGTWGSADPAPLVAGGRGPMWDAEPGQGRFAEFDRKGAADDEGASGVRSAVTDTGQNRGGILHADAFKSDEGTGRERSVDEEAEAGPRHVEEAHVGPGVDFGAR